MKNFSQKLTSFFNDPSFLKEETVLCNSLEKQKKNSEFLTTKAEKTFPQTKNFKLDSFQQNLQKKIYLVVRETNENKNKENILLLLNSQERLKADSVVTDAAYVKYSFFGGSIRDPAFKPWRQGARDIKPKVKRKGGHTLLLRTRRLGQDYYYNNKQNGYKPLCPVFFNFDSAHQFLQNMIAKEAEKSLPNANGFSQKDINKSINRFLSSKVISLSLEDLLQYSSPNTENTILDKVEFLFFPTMEKRSFFTSFNIFPKNWVILKDRKTETFKTYQEKYYISSFPSLTKLASNLEQKT